MDIEVGDRLSTKLSGNVRVTEKLPKNRFSIVFEDTGYIRDVAKNDLITGRVRDRWRKSIRGVACLGDVEIKDYKRMYDIYTWMLERCYVKSCKSYPRYGGRGIKVCDEWLNFSNFVDWVVDNYVEGFDLDKDLLFPEKKEYSPTTCVFLPREINRFFAASSAARSHLPVGVWETKGGKFSTLAKNGNGERVYLGTYNTSEEAFNQYKSFKESRLRSLANKYKSQIPEEAYCALLKWECQPYPE